MVKAFIEPQCLEEAMDARDLEVSTRIIQELTGQRIVMSGLDDEDDILYFAAREGDMIKGYAAFLDGENGLVCLPENEGPMFVGAPEEVIRALSPTMHENSVRWRRDCLMFERRRRALNISGLTPAWTAFYSEKPLAHLGFPAHFAVLIGDITIGHATLVVSDGHSQKQIEFPHNQLHTLVPLWRLEWSVAPHEVLAMQGRSRLRLLPIGSSEFRVGMMFNDMGGLVSWSPAASHCDLMAALCKDENSGFTRHELYSHLNTWLNI